MEKFNRGNYVTINGKRVKRSWYNDSKDLMYTLGCIPFWDLRKLCKIHTFRKWDQYGYIYILSNNPNLKISVQHEWFDWKAIDTIQLLFFNSVEMEIVIDSDELYNIGVALNHFKVEKSFKNLLALRRELKNFSGTVKYF